MAEDPGERAAQQRDVDTAPSPSPSALRIGELLLRRALISQNDLALALSEQELNRGSAPIGRLLVRLGAIDETVLTETLAEQAGMRVVDLDSEVLDPSTRERLPREAAIRLQALPLHYRNSRLVVALAEPPTREFRREILRLSTRRCDFVLAHPSELSDAIDRSYPQTLTVSGEVAVAADTMIDIAPMSARRSEPDTRGAPAVGVAEAPGDRVVAWLLSHAAELGASAMHLIEEESEVRIRARVDDEMRDALDLPISVGRTLVQHVMHAAGLGLDEGAAQVGWLDSKQAGFGPNLRVAVAPTRTGRAVVVESTTQCREPTLDELGLPPDALAGLRAAATHRGLIVVAGNDRDSRSTALRAIITDAVFRECSVVTVEVPFGPPLPGAIQLEVPAGHVGSTQAIRAALGLDADVLVVATEGDNQALVEATQAALGDRVVLVGLDVPDIATAIGMLCELAHPFVVAGSLTFALATTGGAAFETLAASDAVREVIMSGGGAEALARAAQ